MEELKSVNALKQEWFDKCWNHFIINGGKPAFTKGDCYYRLDLTAECPVRCNFGVLIPDAEYKPSFETFTASTVLTQIPSFRLVEYDYSERFELNEFADQLQGAHDNAAKYGNGDYFIAMYKGRMIKVASENKLTVPE